MKIILIVLISGLLFTATAHGQLTNQPMFKPTGKALKIGDRVPDVVLDKVLKSGDTHSSPLSAYTDKLLIIDFWATTCAGCIKSFPKLDSLTRTFDGELTILLSTYEDEDRVKRFMENNPVAKRVSLQTVVEDKQLGEYFEHSSVPHVAWIYKGEVMALTGTEYVNAANISSIINNQPVSWPVKKKNAPYDGRSPLLQLPKDILSSRNRLQYSALLGYMDGIGSAVGVVTDSVQRVRRGYLVNLPVINAYFLLYMRTIDVYQLKRPHIFITPNQLVVEGGLNRKDLWYERSVSGYQAAWEREHNISLEVVLPDSGQSDREVYVQMLAELNRLLGVEAAFENRTVDCLVLENLEGVAKNSAQLDSLSAESALTMLVQNNESSVGNLVYEMNLERDNPPVFDESAYKGEIEIATQSRTDITQLNKALAPYGLIFRSEPRAVDLFVIKKR